MKLNDSIDGLKIDGGGILFIKGITLIFQE